MYCWIITIALFISTQFISFVSLIILIVYVFNIVHLFVEHTNRVGHVQQARSTPRSVARGPPQTSLPCLISLRSKNLRRWVQQWADGRETVWQRLNRIISKHSGWYVCIHFSVHSPTNHKLQYKLWCLSLQTQAFNMIDQNRDGFIDHEDLKDMLASLGECQYQPQ